MTLRVRWQVEQGSPRTETGEVLRVRPMPGGWHEALIRSDADRRTLYLPTAALKIEESKSDQ